MKNTNKKQHRLRIFAFSTLLISIISITGFAAYAMQPVSIPLEVKEPLTILEHPTGFNLYAGETTNFEFTVENQASVTIFQEFEFLLNDPDYQSEYVTFSNHNYSILPGINKLNAWLTIDPIAPAANFIITINKKIETPTPTPIPTTNLTLTPTLELLAGGTKWAAQEGNSALFISWKANWEAHHTTDGTDWSYPSEKDRNDWQKSVITALEAADLDITLAGDLPYDLSKYDVLVIYSYFALEPHNELQIRDYIYNGGNIVLIGATPAYLVEYSKTLACTNNLESIEDWFGASRYTNSGGPIKVIVEHPLGTSFSANEIIFPYKGSSAGAVGSLSTFAEAVACYTSGEVVAFTHEYGAGRVYYQGYFLRLQ
jgi:hypothetical protein